MTLAPALDAWQPWRPADLAARLAACGTPWCVAGGWAVDLWYGEQTRAHGDIEFAIPRSAFDRLRACFADCALYLAGDGEVHPLEGAPDARYHQVWVLDPAAGRWRTDIFLEPGDLTQDGGRTWICRRDPRLRRPYAEVVGRTADGIPYLRPEIVLLFKAKAARDKDEADLDLALPRLDPAARRWLADALDLVHPGHAWRRRVIDVPGRYA
jgi:Aminoglycoside-2''-adenylyltransferase